MNLTTQVDWMEKVHTFFSSRKIYWCFWLSSFIIFSPLFIYSQYIISSTDSVFNHYPNLIFGCRELKAGGFGLWCPNLFAGTDFTSSMHHHMLNPINWIIALFPEE